MKVIITPMLSKGVPMVTGEPALSVTICLGRDGASNQPFGARAVATCQRIAPIVTALAEAHWSDLAPGGHARGQSLPVALAQAARRGLGGDSKLLAFSGSRRPSSDPKALAKCP